MLMDLDKDILKEMGITVIGDIIAILKHAKDVYREVLLFHNIVYKFVVRDKNKSCVLFLRVFMMEVILMEVKIY